MTTAKALEHRIIQHVLHAPRDDGGEESLPPSSRWAERLIAVLAATAGLFVVGVFMEELLWVLLAGATVFCLGLEQGG